MRKLHLEKLDVGCSLVDQLPRVLYYWNRLTDLRWAAGLGLTHPGVVLQSWTVQYWQYCAILYSAGQCSVVPGIASAPMDDPEVHGLSNGLVSLQCCLSPMLSSPSVYGACVPFQLCPIVQGVVVLLFLLLLGLRAGCTTW